MTGKDWFSSMAVFLLRVGDQERGDIQRSLYVFRAKDFDDALEVAIHRAERDQQSWSNSEGDLVQWIFVTIETLDWLGSEITDGREVYAEPGPTVPVPSGPLSFHPQLANPTQSGV